MKRENPFINRPVKAVSLSVVIVLVGCIALFTLPVQQYPDIAPPTVRVTATYTGADAEAVQQSVLVPLEESINGVEDIIYMTSTANNSGETTGNLVHATVRMFAIPVTVELPEAMYLVGADIGTAWSTWQPLVAVTGLPGEFWGMFYFSEGGEFSTSCFFMQSQTNGR